jgi:uncharacterized protein DUF4268
VKQSSRGVSRLEIVPVRQAFTHEAHNFTRWLESHIEALSERVGLDLTVTAREQRVGDFSIDLVCEDADGGEVVIENQLARTDHNHLGQLLTYLVNLDAKKAIWITTEPRPEHQKVIEWLNETSSTDVGFYLVRVEAAKIGDSPYAPIFTVLSMPNERIKEVGETKKEWAARHHNRYAFWSELLEKSKGRTKLFSTISPVRFQYINMGAGQSGIYFAYTITRKRGTAELVIDKDKQEGGLKNKQMFDLIKKRQSDIEKAFGGPLEWDRMDGSRSSRIRKSIEGEPFEGAEGRALLQDQMIDSMIRLHAALKPFLEKLSSE